MREGGIQASTSQDRPKRLIDVPPLWHGERLDPFAQLVYKLSFKFALFLEQEPAFTRQSLTQGDESMGRDYSQLRLIRTCMVTLALVPLAFFGLSVVNQTEAVAFQCTEFTCPRSPSLDGLVRVEIQINGGAPRLPTCGPRSSDRDECLDAGHYLFSTTEPITGTPLCQGTNVYSNGDRVAGPCKLSASDGLSPGLAPVRLNSTGCLTFDYKLEGISQLHFFDPGGNDWTIEAIDFPGTGNDRPGIEQTAVITTLSPRSSWASVMILDGTAMDDDTTDRKRIQFSLSGSLTAQPSCRDFEVNEMAQVASGNGQVHDDV